MATYRPSLPTPSTTKNLQVKRSLQCHEPPEVETRCIAAGSRWARDRRSRQGSTEKSRVNLKCSASMGLPVAKSEAKKQRALPCRLHQYHVGAARAPSQLA